ncbi:MAG: peptidoglycan-binding protein [Planctomycetes bacterium]|nr:peptidoglycan-binding protein [Planctomycetota bacterium]
MGRGHAVAALSVALAVGLLVAPAAADPPADYGLLDGARRAAPSLRRGDTGPAVRALQNALVAAGHPVAVDGVFGGETDRGVRAFQTAQRCSVDGVVGPETVRALDRVLGAPGTPPTTTTRPPATPPPATPPPATPPPAGARRGGAEVLASVRGLSRTAREAALLREVRAGNVPAFLRGYVPVTASAGGRTLVYRVSPDYLSVGHDADFVRIPLSGDAAQAAADALGALLPTTRMVDQVFAQAALRLTPQPLPPGAAMVTPDYFLLHHRRVEAQRAGRALGPLTAGHKKDVVVTNRLVARPDRVAIYGWHQPSGQPIQPLSLVHERGYADYSHGVRLVLPDAVLDGRAVRLADVLRDPALAGLVSAEGALRTLRVAP